MQNESKLKRLLELAKGNPNHDKRGRFAAGPGGAQKANADIKLFAPDDELRRAGHDPVGMRAAIAAQHAIENEAPADMDARHAKEIQALARKHVREQNDKRDHGPLGEKEQQRDARQSHEIEQMRQRHVLEQKMAANARQRK